MQNTTPNRERLAALIAEREAASAELETLTARSHRLAREREVIPPLEAELIALNSAESSAMLRWAELDDGSPAPAADAKRRAKIEAKLATARASARAADSATVSVSSQIERVADLILQIKSHIEQTAASIITEDAMTLFPELQAAISSVEVLYGRLRAARMFAIRVTEPAPGQAVVPNLIDFAKFDRELDLASARPERVEDTGEWFSLAQALQADATATLGAVS
jgi:hypothetical protein